MKNTTKKKKIKTKAPPSKQINLEAVDKYLRKYYLGFTDTEIAEILKEYPGIVMDKFNSAMRGITCAVVDGNTLVYPPDLKKAIICGLENRDLHFWEWD